MSLYVADKTAFVEYAGERIKVIKDQTIARGGHEILKLYGYLFRPLHVHFECERPKPVNPPTPPVQKPAPAKVVKAEPAAVKATTPEPAEGE